MLLQVLAVNAAKDATELVAKLRAYHHAAQTKADKKHLSRYSALWIMVHPQPIVYLIVFLFSNVYLILLCQIDVAWDWILQRGPFVTTWKLES